jgi:hypothetical protein
MLTLNRVTKLPARTARGSTIRATPHAAYGTQRDIATAMCQGKRCKIVPATWSYTPNTTRLIKTPVAS